MSENQFEIDSRRLKERMQQARDILPEETSIVDSACERVRMGKSTYWKELADQTMSITRLRLALKKFVGRFHTARLDAARLRAALEKFVGCINVTGGVLKYESGNIAGCGGDPEWIDLSDAYIAACEALGIEPKTQLVDDEDDDYESGTESLFDLVQKEPPDSLDKLVAASEALVRATTGIRGRNVDSVIIDEVGTFDTLPRLNIKCECSLGISSMPHAGGTTSLPVIRVEAEDDGSFTAVTNYWPSRGDDPT